MKIFGSTAGSCANGRSSGIYDRSHRLSSKKFSLRRGCRDGHRLLPAVHVHVESDPNTSCRKTDLFTSRGRRVQSLTGENGAMYVYHLYLRS
ncbi:hypothetical protein L1987_42595 [Smallanthus sonchifolius]|uniref:Uncharacterized protein n=1 Tax=Smallanthus sonchifolius TaxID=185202 RepID=A0ACB9GK95_9ASTR|nr:hypothetical protein L1987_42595 [Smallanthus sonchifolius]